MPLNVIPPIDDRIIGAHKEYTGVGNVPPSKFGAGRWPRSVMAACSVLVRSSSDPAEALLTRAVPGG